MRCPGWRPKQELRFLGFSVSRFLWPDCERNSSVLLLILITLASGRSSAQSPVYTDPPDVCITSFASGIYQAEPSVFIDPNQPGHLLVTANTWSSPDYEEVRVCPCVSSDGGASWQCQTATIIPLAYGDPASVITKNGRHYSMFLHNYSGGGGDQGLAVSISGGTPSTWSAAAFPGYAPIGGYLDKGHLWGDNSLPTPQLYAAWTLQYPVEQPQVYFRHAVESPTLYWLPDDGPTPISDVAGRALPSTDIPAHVQSGPSNRVLACWANGPAIYSTNKLGFARSLNNGDTWPLKKYITQVIDGGIPKTLELVSPGRIDGPNTVQTGLWPCMAFHPPTNELLLVWNNKYNPVIHNAGNTDVWLIKSPDFGDTWYGPVRVNQDQSGAQWYPWITVDDLTGAIVVLYYDSRDHVPFAAEVYASISSDDGATWTDVRISDGGPGSPPAPSYTALVSGTGNDYVGVMARNGIAYPVWADDRERTPSQTCPAPLRPQECSSGPAPPLKVYTSAILLGGIDAASIYTIVSQHCADVGDPRVRFEADWSTLIDMNGLDKLTVIPPGQSPLTVSASSTSSTHQLVKYSVPCVTGNWAYVVESSKGLGVSRSDTLYKWVSCMSCPPPCRPPCEFE